ASGGLITAFVVDPKLMDTPAGDTPRHQFLRALLESLQTDLKDRGVTLLLTSGSPSQMIPALCREYEIEQVTWTEDYTPYAIQRDDQISHLLQDLGIRVRTHKARVVFDYSEILTQDGRPFSVYTPYWKRWSARLEDQVPKAEPLPRFQGLPARSGIKKPPALSAESARVELPASNEKAAGRRLDRFLEHRVGTYAEDRDRPDLDGTSRLSPALRFGLLSPRQCVLRALDAVQDDPDRQKGATKWINEIAWREFYSATLATHPSAAKRSIQPAYRSIEWNDDPNGLKAWREGMTGYPIVDAGMRQLSRTGWMHNRVRMIVASFLVKDLLIDWRIGERHFFDRLLDGDPASNNGGWQWAASTGHDAAPYFRIFNPTRQGERFDPQGNYVRRWIPELEGLAGSAVHRPWETPLMAGGYPEPIVDHAERRILALTRYKAAREAYEARKA
ncbi:DNA photolyase family protein, partial [Myxococcota bacterium]|nr:DNA photolyase family protein [Myxococcota bacterium]